MNTCTCHNRTINNGATFCVWRNPSCPLHGDAVKYPVPDLKDIVCAKCGPTKCRYDLYRDGVRLCGACFDAQVHFGRSEEEISPFIASLAKMSEDVKAAGSFSKYLRS